MSRMCCQVWGDNFQCPRLAEYPMIVEAVVAEKLVQEQFDFLVLQPFHLNPVSLG